MPMGKKRFTFLSFKSDSQSVKMPDFIGLVTHPNCCLMGLKFGRYSPFGPKNGMVFGQMKL